MRITANPIGPFSCPLCDGAVESGEDDKRNIFVDCKRCGNFAVTAMVLGEVIALSAERLRPFLSAATRQAHENGNRLLVTTENWREYATRHSGISFAQKVDTFLRLIGERCRAPGGWTTLDMRLEYPLISATSASEVDAYLQHLRDINLLEGKEISSKIWECSLTIPGWNALQSTKQPGGKPGTCFVAMSFDPEMTHAYDVGIDPAIRDCGVTPIRVDRLEHNEQITDKMMAEIRDAEFMVADFTGNRPSVYYEAGFASGLGRKVIYCCREDSITDLHFDTRGISHVAWKDPEDLREKLKNRIRRTILPQA